MFAGPLLNREALTLPRQFRFYLLRSGYVFAFFVLLYTAGQATFGWQTYRSLTATARFGELTFQIFALVQMTLMVATALLMTAGNIAQEKDRRTLILLLMTDLRDHELVLGKLLASLLQVGTLLATSVPVFIALHMLGGITLTQIGLVIAISACAALAAGSWGTLVAFWREKTFQTLATALLGMVVLLGIVEGAVAIVGIENNAGQLIAAFNPYRAMSSILSPLAGQPGDVFSTTSAFTSIGALLVLAIALNVASIIYVRVWNPSRQIYLQATTGSEEETRANSRTIWEYPILWREIMTRAYGRKMIVIKAVYLLISAAVGFLLVTSGSGEESLILGMISQQGFLFVMMSLLSMMLVNAQSVTSMTSERDAQTLEPLLVTDITAKEFIFGKLAGAFYNTKEAVIVPLLIVGYLLYSGILGLENSIYVAASLLVLIGFSATLGLHSGLSFENSRTAILNSLGTMFFLFIGIFVCMMLIVEARSSFALQLPSFLLFILGGGIGLWASLTHKNPSPALTMAAALLPFLTFYAIVAFLLDGSIDVCLSICCAYGFTVLAMLIPSISEFDAALGRTSSSGE